MVNIFSIQLGGTQKNLHNTDGGLEEKCECDTIMSHVGRSNGVCTQVNSTILATIRPSNGVCNNQFANIIATTEYEILSQIQEGEAQQTQLVRGVQVN